MFSIAFICPYFGQLPKDLFNLWLKSCKYNPSIDWLIFTNDRTNYDYPENVKVSYIEFEDFKAKFQEKFAFPLKIEQPYKLCDLRPTFGYVLQEYINKYDFWGYCDVGDMIFGNLRKFLTDENLSQADKIMKLGHMTLFKNTEENNSRFMLKAKKVLPLEKIFGIKKNKIFDEFGINYIYMEHNFPIKTIDNMYMDIIHMSLNFKICYPNEDFTYYDPDKKGRCFLWEHGKLYAYEKDKEEKIQKKEIGYVHFKRRRMVCNVPLSDDSFYIIPNQFIPVSCEMNETLFKEYTKKRISNAPSLKLIIKHLIQKLKSTIKRIINCIIPIF